MSSKAEDTLKVLWMNEDTSGHIQLSDSLYAESPLDNSSSEDSIVSGPSSPCASRRLLRCRNCESLFSKMQRQGSQRKKQRDTDPASLSCDEWQLKKTRHPRRWQQSRGRLWVYLKRIRRRAVKEPDDAEADKLWWHCSRPHVFLQRNLRRCKSKSARQGKAKPQRGRAKPTQPLRSASHQRQKKRKSSEKEDASGRLSSLDLTITTEDELHTSDSDHHEGLYQLQKVPKKHSSTAASGFMDIQANSSVLEGTRRVLKFDTSPKAVLKNAGEILHKGRADFTVKTKSRPTSLTEGLDVFRTPVDHFDVDLKIARKIRPSRPFSARKDSFRNALAAVAQGHNQIIKESHH